MSIFKETIPGYVQNQLLSREILISQGDYSGGTNKTTPYGISPRQGEFLKYVAGKNSWTRMTSFVNVNKKIGNKTYSGMELSKKYVLEGGVLYKDKKTGDSILRSGVGNLQSPYGGDLDIGGNRPFGIRPMPSITSISVTNKSAYGSLREATIKYYCWDKHQLEELELLFMRTGYSVLLEWGWSQYLDSSNLNSIKMVNFDDNSVINPFQSGLTDGSLYDQIKENNSKYHGNYDAMLGFVKNFSWNLMPNGGFDCSTVLISRGEVISTIKLSSNTPNQDLGLNKDDDAPILSQFEQMILNYMGLIANFEFTGGEFDPSKKVPTTTDTVSQFSTTLKSTDYTLYDDAGGKFDYKSGFKSTSNVSSGATVSHYYGGFVPLNTPDDQYGYVIEYLRFDMLIALLNIFFNLKDKNSKTIAQILIPKSNQCLASYYSTSIDPTVCQINTGTNYFGGVNFCSGYTAAYTQYITQRQEFQQKIAEQDAIINDPASDDVSRASAQAVKNLYTNAINQLDAARPTSGGTQSDFIKAPMANFFTNKDCNRGLIGGIYVSLPKVLEIYRSKAGNNGDVDLVDFLKDLLNELSKALGGLNSFQLHTTKSTIEIIDAKYLEKGLKKNKFEFNLMGLKSICRDVKIQSRIFESQSTMIGIAAGNNGNAGDIYSSTMGALNAGLTDRVLSEKKVNPEAKKAIIQTIRIIDANNNVTHTVIYADGTKDTNLSDADFLNIMKDVASIPIQELTRYVDNKVRGGSVALTSTGRLPEHIILPSSDEVSNAGSVLRTVMLQFDGKNINKAAIIPFELEITLDGISGVIIGNVFTINEDILPSGYSNAGVGFVVTGVSHSLQNNDWTTTIKAQICLLD